ncbi:MAG: cytochrome P460 family protein [Sedimenticola sp.]
MKMNLLMVAGVVGMVTTMGALAAAAPFGGADDVAYANKLWKAMEKSHYVGGEAIMSTPYTGVHPHGAILDTIEGPLAVDGSVNKVMVKRNYGGDAVTKQAVADDPKKWLKAVTVMYKRPGYDAETKDWFWVKYSPAGMVLKNPKNMALAGKVGKGGSAGCVACHQAAPGGDLVFNHD